MALREVDLAFAAVRRHPDAHLGVVAQAHLQRGRVRRAAGRPERALGAVARAVRLNCCLAKCCRVWA